jgi:hypothetical protein
MLTPVDHRYAPHLSVIPMVTYPHGEHSLKIDPREASVPSALSIQVPIVRYLRYLVMSHESIGDERMSTTTTERGKTQAVKAPVSGFPNDTRMTPTQGEI